MASLPRRSRCRDRPKHQHVEVQVRAMQPREVGCRQRLRQIQPQHLRAEATRQPPYLESLRNRRNVCNRRLPICRIRNQLPFPSCRAGHESIKGRHCMW
jgi:hypothetical protein